MGPSDQTPAHALITGASSGIGAATALLMAEQGCAVTLCARAQVGLDEQARRIQAAVPKAKLHIATMDITQQRSIDRACDSAQKALGAVRILVNCAGVAQSQAFLKSDLAHWRQMLEVNLLGCVQVTQAVLPSMLEAAAKGQAGRIINIASTAGLRAYPYVSAYVASKHALIGLTKSLALELARKNVTVNAVCPGYTETSLLDAALENISAKTGLSREQALAQLQQHNPMQRLVQPQEVAQTVWWLCGQGSGSINGQAIAVDGGELAG